MSFDGVWVHSRRRMAILMCALPTIVPKVASSSYLCSMTDLEYYWNDTVTAMHSGQCMPLP